MDRFWNHQPPFLPINHELFPPGFPLLIFSHSGNPEPFPVIDTSGRHNFKFMLEFSLALKEFTVCHHAKNKNKTKKTTQKTKNATTTK